MSMQRAKAHLEKKGYLDRVIEPAVETATVEQAAAALGCEPAHIAKSMSFYGADDAESILIQLQKSRRNPVICGIPAAFYRPDV